MFASSHLGDTKVLTLLKIYRYERCLHGNSGVPVTLYLCFTPSLPTVYRRSTYGNLPSNLQPISVLIFAGSLMKGRGIKLFLNEMVNVPIRNGILGVVPSWSPPRSTKRIPNVLTRLTCFFGPLQDQHLHFSEPFRSIS